MTRRLTLLFAALLALLGAGPATTLAGVSADPAPGAQNCARASLSAAPTHAGLIGSGSACTRPVSTADSARTALGCCVATKAGPTIKPGSAGGPTAGQRFPESVRQAEKAADPTSTCVFCGMPGRGAQVDHAIPRARGGNATRDNAQLACPHCNASKGGRDYPVNPPPGYEGPWPPRHWSRGGE